LDAPEKTESEILFKKGLTAFQDKDFSLSVESFKAIRAQGTTSVALELNLGKALTENGQLSEGLAHLGLASYMSRGNSETLENLKFAQSRIENGWGTRMSHPAEFFVKLETKIHTEEFFFYYCCFFIFVSIEFILSSRRSF
jgi:Flp pilus assembly protein TadD